MQNNYTMELDGEFGDDYRLSKNGTLEEIEAEEKKYEEGDFLAVKLGESGEYIGAEVLRRDPSVTGKVIQSFYKEFETTPDNLEKVAIHGVRVDVDGETMYFKKRGLAEELKDIHNELQKDDEIEIRYKGASNPDDLRYKSIKMVD